MVMIKKEVPINELPEDHPARNEPNLPAGSDLPHPAFAPHLQQESYQHEFAIHYGGAYTGLPPLNPSAPAHQNMPPVGNHALQDYQMQLMLLERQDKKRRMDAQLLAHSPAKRGLEQPSHGNHALQDYQMQLMLLEQQNKKRAAQKELDDRRKAAEQQARRNQLQNYQMQLMLLEQQNKKRLMMARCQKDGDGKDFVQCSTMAVQEHSLKTEEKQTLDLAVPAWNPEAYNFNSQLPTTDYYPSYTANEYPYHSKPQVAQPALPGTPGTVCSPPMIPQEPTQNPTLVIRGGPPSTN